MKETLERIHKSALEDIEKIQSTADIEEIRNTYLSRKSELNNIKKNLKDLSNDDKRIVGSLSNQITKDIEEKLNEKYQTFYQKELNEVQSRHKSFVDLFQERGSEQLPYGEIQRYRHCNRDQIDEVLRYNPDIFKKIPLQKGGSALRLLTKI